MGVSLIDSAATFASARSSLYVPDRTIGMLHETFYRTGRVLRNTVDRATPNVPIGTPVVGALSTVVTTLAAGGNGYDTAKAASSAAVTFALLMKRPSSGTQGGLLMNGAANYLGLYWSTGGNFRFYNSQTSVTSPGGDLAAPASTDFIFVMGWGNVSDYGLVQYGTGGALSSLGTNTTLGQATRSTSANVKLGGSSVSGSLVWEAAWSAVFNAVLTTPQRLALYQEVRAAAAKEGIVVL